MKIFPLRPLAPIDKLKNLMFIMKEYPPITEKSLNDKVSLINAEFTKSELRSEYKNAIKMLHQDKFEKQKG